MKHDDSKFDSDHVSHVALANEPADGPMQAHDPMPESDNWACIYSEPPYMPASDYENMFLFYPTPSLLLDSNLVIRDANHKAVELFQFRSRTALINHSLMRMLDIHDAKRLQEVINDEQHKREAKISGLKTRHNNEQVLDLCFTWLSMNDSAHTHFMASFIDVTSRHRQITQLQMLEAITNNTGARISAYYANNRCIYANSTELEHIGLDYHDVIGRRRDCWMPDADVAFHEKQDALVYTSRKPTLNELPENTRGSATRYFLSHKFPLIDDQGVTFAVGNISTDVTSEKQRNERLDIALIAYSMGNEAVMICNAQGDIVSVNRAFSEITGYAETDVLGKNPKVLSSGKHDEAFYQQMWQSLQAKGHWEGEIWNRRKNRTIYPQWMSLSRVPGGSSPTTHYIAVFSDQTNRKLAEEQIQQLAFYDALTNLPNRYLLSDRVHQLIDSSARTNERFSMVFFDLDRFKNINDVHGHAIGDKLLIEVARRVTSMIRKQDTLARLGGDEFVLLFPGLSGDDVAAKIDKMRTKVCYPYTLDDLKITTSASFGIATFPEDGQDMDTLLKNADTAMYRVKADGRGSYAFFSQHMAESARENLALESYLNHALDNSEFHLVYQPQLNLTTREVSGLEVLLRWHSPQLGPISPEIFIPILEKLDQIEQVGYWVFDEAIKFFVELKKIKADLSLSINLSARQFTSYNLVEKLQQLVQQRGLRCEEIELEITESTIMDIPEKSLKIMQALKDIGFKLALDDFGTGYSSMAYLNWMPLDKIKIDKSFVCNLEDSPKNKIICQSIIQLAQSLGIDVIAEGIETQQQLDILLAQGCNTAQGYHFAPPIDRHATLVFVTRKDA
jgi:diguanylate cyclase (GGDEF)-like protein/PAS domain S-box-containing protein